MAAEELNKPSGAPKPAAGVPESNVGKGDMAHLIGNMGVLIDSTIESVQGMINTVSSATGQIIEGVTTTINSEPVKEILHNVNTVSGQLIEGVTATLKSEPVQNSFNELGKFWENLLSNLNATVNSDQVKNLFDNVSTGMGQLVGTVFSGGMPPSFMPVDDRKKHVQQIHLVSPKESVESVKSSVPEDKIVTN
jgi:chlorosome envelope protein H